MTTVTKERDMLGRQIMMMLAGHRADTAVAALCDALACGVGILSSSPDDAADLVARLMPDIQTSARRNFEDVKRQQIRMQEPGSA